MKPEAKEIIQKQLAHIPAGVRDALLKISSSNYLGTLAEKNRLRTDQAGVLEDELMLVLLGLETPETFIKNLMEQGNMSRALAETIVHDINEDIFNKIRHDLAEFQQQTRTRFGEGQSIPKPPPAAPPQNLPTGMPPRPTPPPQPEAQGPQGVVRTLGNDLARTKLEQAFRMPPSTTTVTETQRPQQNPIVKKPYGGQDPYREATT
jgi:hypothetical protein